MASIFRVKAEWAGFPGGPGISVFHFATFEGNFGPGAQGAVVALDAFFTAAAPLIPNNITITIGQEVEIIEDSTGELINYVPDIAPGSVAGANSGNWAGPVGAVVNWTTSTVRRGRRIRGRTFLVPLANGAFDDNGNLVDGQVTTLQTAANNLLAATDVTLLVFGRPTPGLSDGVSAEVTSARVPDLAAVLRSRRD